MQKLKNGEMIQLLHGIRDIESKILPVKVSYALLKNSKQLSEDLKSYNESLKNLTDENGNILSDKFEDLKELLEIENEVLLQTIRLSDLENCELTLKELAVLEPIIEEEV